MPQDKLTTELAKRNKQRDGRPPLPKILADQLDAADRHFAAARKLGIYKGEVTRTPAQVRKDRYGERTSDVRLR